jgi:predicted nucleotidyltransferase
MFIHEREALKDVIKALRGRLRGKIVSAHTFGSRVRESHNEWSDFDPLVVVDGRTTALRLQKIPNRPDYEAPTAVVYDYAASRSDVDSGRVAIMAYSMDGYYAPRAALSEKHFDACVAWGGHFDYHATWITRRKILEGGGIRCRRRIFNCRE